MGIFFSLFSFSAMVTTVDRVISELISTEKQYVADLSILTNSYLLPIQNFFVQSPELLVDFGTHVEQLLLFHKIFSVELDQKASNGFNALAKVFLQFADYMKLYTQYVNGFEKCLAAFNKMQENAKFVKFYSKLNDAKVTKGLSRFHSVVHVLRRLMFLSLIDVF